MAALGLSFEIKLLPSTMTRERTRRASEARRGGGPAASVAATSAYEKAVHEMRVLSPCRTVASS